MPKASKSLSGERAVALVIVLAFIVLVIGVIVAYFSRSADNRQFSNNSFNQAKAGEMARSALAIVTSDLEQEIVNGSQALGSPVVYVPTAAANMVPQRNGTSPTPAGSPHPMPALLRISAPPSSLWGSDTALSSANATPLAAPGVDHPAWPAAISSAVSANGRSVSAARWNQSYLLPLKTPTDSGSDSTPVDAFLPPRWVYVDVKGPMLPSAGSLPTGSIGRYAYAVYDEGALLDMNVAGLPLSYPAAGGSSTDPTVMTAAQAKIAIRKGVINFADLTQLPAAGTNNYLTAAQASNLVGWRNYASFKPPGTLPAPSTTGTPGPGFKFVGTPMDLFLAAPFASPTPGVSPAQTPNAYLKAGGTTWQGDAGTGTDQMFLGRQQLIAFQKGAGGFSANALQYMGTFTRAINAPSWMPSANSTNLPGYVGTTTSSSYAYKDNAETAGQPNRDLPNVRYTSGQTLYHYNDDGTKIPQTLASGASYLQHRFSLKRIDWMTHTGVANGIPAAAVEDCFGLRWTPAGDGSSYARPCWTYVHGTGGTPNKILTLDQVASLNREPDFFEMLKAGILAGSVGLDPGLLATGNTDSYANGVGGYNFEAASASPDMQIIQIGANIIDQWDSDSYPTAIYFPHAVVLQSSPLSPGSTDMAGMAYGVENLPYLNRIFRIFWDRNSANNRVDGWFQPELWNPFQTPTVTTNRPTAFCVRAYGGARLNWRVTGYGFYPGSPSGVAEAIQYDTFPDGGSNDACVYYNDSVPSSFANPSLLTSANVNGSAPVTNSTMNMVLSSEPDRGGHQVGRITSNYFLAIHAGFTNYQITNNPASQGGTVVYDSDTRNDPETGKSHAQNIKVTIKPYSDQTLGVTFCMQYYDASSGKFMPYSYLSRYNTALEFNYNINSDNGPLDGIYGDWTGFDPVAHTDPLTDRFSVLFSDASHIAQDSPWHYATNNFNQTWELAASSSVAGPCAGVGGQYGAPTNANGNFIYMSRGTSSYSIPANNRGLYTGTWAQNNVDVSNLNQTYAVYLDPDGVPRPGNDYLWNPANNTSGTDASGAAVGFANGDGMSQLAGGYDLNTGTGVASQAKRTVGRRPLVLNRPFQSVAELGYAYRDLPFKTLDMFTPYSADAALLDLFSIRDEPAVAAGRININNSPVPVIQAIIAGTNKQELDATYTVSNSNQSASGTATNEATLVAKNIAITLAPPVLGSNGTPVVLGNRADLVTKLMDRTRGIPSAFVTSADRSDKTFVEAPIRALADVTNTRTWNLLIDVVAQSGQMAPNATKADQFLVQGENRYWLHVAIDRFTGQVIDQQLEQVSE